MQDLYGEKIYLRALESQDLEFLYTVENDMSFWEISNTQTPYSKHVLTQYLANAHQDIYEAKQLRLVIVDKKNDQPIGWIDLYDFNPQHKRAGRGILLIETARNQGFAFEALTILIKYCFKNLNLHQVFASISHDNKASLSLFKKHDFKQIGIRKDWIYHENSFKDEILLQLINL